MSWVEEQLDALDGVDSGWWAAQEAADAAHEAEFGPVCVREPWVPAHVRLKRQMLAVTYGQDEKSCASSAESQEARY